MESGESKPAPLLVGTRKGAFIYRGGATPQAWQLDGPHLLGSIVNHLVTGPRDGRTLLMAANTGHPGPTVFHLHGGGRSWAQAKLPAAFKAAAPGEEGR